MKRPFYPFSGALAGLALAMVLPAAAETPTDFLRIFEQEARKADPAFQGFSVERGRQFFQQPHGNDWSCASCHTDHRRAAASMRRRRRSSHRSRPPPTPTASPTPPRSRSGSAATATTSSDAPARPRRRVMRSPGSRRFANEETAMTTSMLRTTAACRTQAERGDFSERSLRVPK
jgi:mono/diheme cytochrome c family protein